MLVGMTVLLGVGAMASDSVNVWVTDALVKVLPDAAAPAGAPKGVEIDAVRNEYESGQVVVSAAGKIGKLTASIGPFGGPDGPKPRAEVRFEGYVSIKKGTTGTPPDHLVAQAPADLPDPLLEKRSVSVEAGKNQPIWITIYVPKTAKPGKYTSTVEIMADGASRSVPISVQVHNFALPDDRTLYLTNWFSPGNIARSHKREVWDERFWKVLETYAECMAAYRQNVVVTPILELIKGHDDGKGKLTFDFTRFNRWVELFQRAGVIGYIEGGHFGGRSPWEAPDFDAWWPEIFGPDGKPLPKPAVKVTSEEYRKFLSRFLPALQKHLERKGWLAIYMQHLSDEPIKENAESYKKLASYVRKYAPKFKIIEACMCSELAGSVDIWVPQPPHFEADINFFRERQKAGDQVWFYTCLAPKGKYMNRFVDYPLIDVRLLHWVNFKYDLPGYLHWGFNYYQADPFKDLEPDWGGGNCLPPGDSHIVYPGLRGPLSSIRLEALRDGVEDYEMLKLLEKKNPKLAREIADSVVRSLTDYTMDPGEFRAARMRIVNALAVR